MTGYRVEITAAPRLVAATGTLLCTEAPGCTNPAEWKVLRRGRWTGRACCPHHATEVAP